MGKKKKSIIWILVKGFFKTIWWIIKAFGAMFYSTFRLFYKGAEKTTEKVKKSRAQAKRPKVNAKHEKFEILHTNEGDYEKFEKFVHSNPSTIGIIIGARGTGKSALGIKLLENISAKGRPVYALGFNEQEMPNWVNVAGDLQDIRNGSFVLIDEGGILFSSRKSMSKANKLLSEMLLIARHNDLSVVFISQNSANLEVNTLRQADYLLLKPQSLLQRDFERKTIQNLYEETKDDFQKHSHHKGLTYVHSDKFTGFINNQLPSFWTESISKAFKKD